MYDECLLLSEWRTTYEYDVLSFVIYAKTRCFVYHKTPLPAEFVGFSPADGSQKKEETKMDGIDSFTICLHSPNGRQLVVKSVQDTVRGLWKPFRISQYPRVNTMCTQCNETYL